MREERIKEIVGEIAARYINVESNRQSLITVTGVEMRERGKKATILVTVLPEEMETKAIEFLSRKRNDFWRFVQKESRLERVPSFVFAIDRGEKARQRIDALLNS